jgi:NADH:ubiquinone oxidoreductase subunit E
MASNVLTTENFNELKDFIQAHKNQPGALMPVMQKAQEIFGYIGEEIQVCISENLDVPMTEIYGVATFYSQFALAPKGKHVISVCLGTACYVRGSQAILDEISKELGIPVGKTTADGQFTLEATRCLGCCGLAPVMMIGDNVFGRLTTNDIPGIIAKYRVPQA